MLSHDELLKTFLSIFMLNLYPTGAVVGRARMVIGFTTTCATSAYNH
jgi:hypothetical protein